MRQRPPPGKVCGEASAGAGRAPRGRARRARTRRAGGRPGSRRRSRTVLHVRYIGHCSTCWVRVSPADHGRGGSGARLPDRPPATYGSPPSCATGSGGSSGRDVSTPCVPTPVMRTAIAPCRSFDISSGVRNSGVTVGRPHEVRQDVAQPGVGRRRRTRRTEQSAAGHRGRDRGHHEDRRAGEVDARAHGVADLTDSASADRCDAAVRVNIRLIPFENRRTARVSRSAVHMGVLPFVDSTLGLLWLILMTV